MRVIKIAFVLICLCLSSYSWSQYYDSTEIADIHNARSASEGDLYQDTFDQEYYLGLTNGELTKINDPIDSISIVGDTLSVYQGDSSYKAIGIINEPRVQMGIFKIDSNVTGDYVVNNLRFKPNLVEFTAYANIDTTTLDDDNGVGNNVNTRQNSFAYMKGYAQLEADGSTSQFVICGGGNGTSINDISRYAAATRCIGIRYGNQNGDNVGLTLAQLVSFDENGFTINATQVDDGVLIMFTAYR